MLGCFAYLILSCLCEAKEIIPGPIPARVIRVIDGDTLVVSAQIWLGHKIETIVRIKGIDAPELKGKCPYEKELAKEAKSFLKQAVNGKTIMLSDISNGKYAGRVLANIQTDKYPSIGTTLINAGLARPYYGEKRSSWCSDTNPAQPEF
ncbi:MAG: thermonuclease family protein [Alphaproteobacteria bacterium]|nr:thermonuclease family protein [Alphaproteobacteria bacterium]